MFTPYVVPVPHTIHFWSHQQGKFIRYLCDLNIYTIESEKKKTEKLKRTDQREGRFALPAKAS